MNLKYTGLDVIKSHGVPLDAVTKIKPTKKVRKSNSDSYCHIFFFWKSCYGAARADKKANRKPFITHLEILLKSGKKCQGILEPILRDLYHKIHNHWHPVMPPLEKKNKTKQKVKRIDH